MPSSIPGLIEWSSSYSVGIDSIDSQHQTIVLMIRQLQIAMFQGRAREVVRQLIAAMNQYTQTHFAYEEDLLRTTGYPEFDSHSEMHANLVERLGVLEEKYTDGSLTAGTPLMQFLRSWLLDHIGAHDRSYAPFLQEKGIT